MSRSFYPSGPGNKGKVDNAPDGSPEQDPVEGSRETIDRELERTDPKDGSDKTERLRRDLGRQVKEETNLPGRGSA